MPPKGFTKAKIRCEAKSASSIEKVQTEEIECQTDDFANDVSKLDALKSCFESISISARDPSILLYQQRTSLRLIEKLSSDNRKWKNDNDKMVTFIGEIFRLVRAMRSEYDTTFVNVQDDLKSMRYDYQRYMAEVAEHLNKQKKSVEEERKRYKNAMKKKDLHIEDLQSRLTNTAEQVRITMNALEAQQRRVTLAQRDVYNASEEVKDINRKLNDQLYLAGNQKCRSCQANEKVRGILSNEIAEKTGLMENMREKCLEMDTQLQQQKRVNDILSRSVDKHSFSEKAIRSEFDRVNAKCEALERENRNLKAAKKTDTLAAQNASITPPDSSASDKSAKDDTTGNASPGTFFPSTPTAQSSSSPLNPHQLSGRKQGIFNTNTSNKSPIINDSNAMLSPPEIPTQQAPRKKLKKKILSHNTTANELEDGELDHQHHSGVNIDEDETLPERLTQKRARENGLPSGVAMKKTKSLAQKQKMALKAVAALQRRMAVAGASSLNPGPMGIHGRFQEKRREHPAFLTNASEYDFATDRMERAQKPTGREHSVREFHRRSSLENMTSARSNPWHDPSKMNNYNDPQHALPLPYRRSGSPNAMAQDYSTLCPTPPAFLRDFRRCNGATLDDFVNKDNLGGDGPSSRRLRMAEIPVEGERVMRPINPQLSPRHEMECRIPRSSPAQHFQRGFESEQGPVLADIRSHLDMYATSPRALPPRPPGYMPRPPDPPMYRGDIHGRPMQGPPPGRLPNSWITNPPYSQQPSQNTSWLTDNHLYRR